MVLYRERSGKKTRSTVIAGEERRPRARAATGLRECARPAWRVLIVLLVAAAVLFERSAVDAGREPSVAWALLAYIGVGALWMLGIAGVSLLFAPVLLAFAALVRRWPERAAVDPAATLAEAA